MPPQICVALPGRSARRASPSLSMPSTKIVATVLWIVLMIKAYQGVRFHVPVAADIDSLFGKS
jgi:uncharacterized membrane protein